MRQKIRTLVIALAIIGAWVVLDAILVIAAPPTTADVQKGTEAVGKFIECVNDKIKAQGTIDISDTVECLPGSCTVTLTMSDNSAQAACGSSTTCQLPRVILKCPGPPQIELSYLLCGTGSAGAGGVIGSNRVEVGVVVGSSTRTGSDLDAMLMADIPIPPGTSTVGKLLDVLSLVIDPPKTRGSKECNKCHEDGGCFGICGAKLQLSERIEVFGTDPINNTELATYIIHTDDKKIEDKLKELRSGADKDKFKLKEGLKEQPLCEICDCIDEKVKDGSFFTHFPDTTKEQAAVLLKLCRELENYQKTRGLGTPTPCEADTITMSTTSLKLKENTSGDVTVTVAGADGSAVEGAPILVTVSLSGKKRIKVSPSRSSETDKNGQATFTITAKKRRTGKAKVAFTVGEVMTIMTVEISKK